jgi:hypothetical protein
MIYSEFAQELIDTLISKIQAGGGSDDLFAGLEEALSRLVKGMNADRGLLWLVVVDRLTVRSCYLSNDKLSNALGVSLDSKQSTQLVLNFLAQGGRDLIQLNRASPSADDWLTLLALSEQFTSQLLVPLQARGIFSGFVALQFVEPRQCSSLELVTLEKVAALLSVIISYDFDITRLSTDGRSLSALVKILKLFADEPESVASLKAIELIADLFGFGKFQLYLYQSERLVAQGGDGSILELTDDQDPFVDVFKKQRAVIGSESSEFGQGKNFLKTGMLLPLISNETPLGVFAVWEPLEGVSLLDPLLRELALWISSEVSNCIESARARKLPK